LPKTHFRRERIARRIALKLGVRVRRVLSANISNSSPTGKHHGVSAGPPSCATKRTLVACDFFGLITARVRILRVCGHGDRISAHPPLQRHRAPHRRLDASATGETAQGITVIGSSFTTSRRVSRLNWMLASTSTRVLRCLVAAATANPERERLIGSIRREWLDFVIPIHQWHLRRTFRQWSTHSNTAVLIGQSNLVSRMRLQKRCLFVIVERTLSVGSRLAWKPVLGGLHHEYCWENKACAVCCTSP
jgi:putative transposase